MSLVTVEQIGHKLATNWPTPKDLFDERKTETINRVSSLCLVENLNL